MTTDRAWISPEGKVHPVGVLSSHHSWISKTKQENPGLIPGSEHPDTWRTQDAMIDGGWIQKHGPSVYSARPESLDRLKSHLNDHHPEVETAVTSGTGKKMVNRKWVDESRADQLISATLSEMKAMPAWAKRRHAAWISPEGEWHHVPGTHEHWARTSPDSPIKGPHASVDSLMAGGWVRKHNETMFSGQPEQADHAHKFWKENDNPKPGESIVFGHYNLRNGVSIGHDGTRKDWNHKTGTGE